LPHGQRHKEELPIAEAFGLSHQRVHQMIDQAAEPTRRRWWRRRTQLLPGPLGPCSFCGRSREECDDRRVEGPTRLEPWGSEARCSFCGKNARPGVLLEGVGISVGSASPSTA
jgi:ribosomal protein L24E